MMKSNDHVIQQARVRTVLLVEESKKKDNFVVSLVGLSYIITLLIN